MPDLYAGCRIDDQAAQDLTNWKAELQAVEASVRSKLATLQTQLDELTADEKASATLTLTGTGDRVKITYLEAGAEGNNWSVYISPAIDTSGISLRTVRLFTTPLDKNDNISLSSNVIRISQLGLTSDDIGRFIKVSNSQESPSNNAYHLIVNNISTTQAEIREGTIQSDEVGYSGVGDEIWYSGSPLDPWILDSAANVPISVVGSPFTISGAANPTNNGTWAVSNWINPTSWFYSNPSPVIESPFTGSWWIHPVFIDGVTDGVYEYDLPYATVDSTSKLITIYVKTDLVETGEIQTTAQELTDFINNDATLNQIISAESLDAGLLPMDGELVQFSGGHSAALTTTSKALESLFNNKGVTTTTMLDNVGIPVFRTTLQALVDTAGVAVLSTGKTFEATGTSLTVLKELWTLLGEDAGAYTQLVGLLIYDMIVVWTKTTSLTLPADACGTQQERTVSLTEVVAVNSSPTLEAGVTFTPQTYWLGSINPDYTNIALLQRWGLSSSQLVDALDENHENTHIIDSDGLAVFQQLSSNECAELFGLNIEGVSSITYEQALEKSSSKPLGPSTGYMVPMLNFPQDKLKEELSPDSQMALDIQDSSCVDPVGKSGLIAVVNVVDAMISTLASTVGAVTRTISSVVNRASGMVAAILTFFNDAAEEAGCFGGFSLTVDGPNISILKAELPQFSFSMEVTLDLITDVFSDISPVVCKVKQALNELIFIPGDPTLTCLTRGLTNDLVNKFGTQIQVSLPCIANPLDYLSMIEELVEKVNGITSMINSLFRDLVTLQSQIRALANLELESPFKNQTEDCSSAALSVLIGRVKSTFGV